MSTLASVCFYAAAAGLASHLVYFIHGEHHNEAVRVIGCFLVALAVIFVIQTRFLQHDLFNSITYTTAIASSYLVALWTSMIIYRIFFHRLKQFPGPFGAKISKIWHSYMSYPRFDSFRLLGRLQAEYGDIVRTGPNELSIFDPAALPIILGPKCSKAPWYDNTLPLVSIHTARDNRLHAQRRRLWEKGINTKALRMYEERVLEVADTLVQQLTSRSGQPVDVRDWMMFFSFDVTGAIAFGKSFGTVKDGKSHFILDIIKSEVAPFSLLNPIPWAFPLLACLPGNTLKELIGWCEALVEERRKTNNDAEVMDVMSHLVQAYNESSDKAYELNWLHGDSRIIILAGTETSAVTLSFIFYQLAKDTSKQAKLRDELRPLIQKHDQFKVSAVQDAPYLNGIINETLRLYSAGPSGLPRLTPPEGIRIGEKFIPGNVTVIAPFQAVQRHPAAFEKPDEFIPERWYSQPELVKDSRAFAPWSLGPTSCAGKQLALLEIRMLVSLLVTKFTIAFAPGDDGSSVIEEMTDHFTSTSGPLRLVFTPLED